MPDPAHVGAYAFVLALPGVAFAAYLAVASWAVLCAPLAMAQTSASVDGGVAAPAGSAPASGDRPSDDSLFGGPAPSPANDKDAEAASNSSDERAREEAALSGTRSPDAFESGATGPDDPLRIGGQLYLRTFASASVANSRAIASVI